jgi:CubicO group peptidase (beta-lactamase class C family)
MGFEDVASQIDSWVAEGAVQGASIAVWHRGGLVAHRHAGESQPGIPVSDDTLFGLASLSKPITAATVLSVCDEGLLDLDTPVVDILHTFGAEVDRLRANAMLEARRDDITLRQMLAHTSGMPENVDSSLYDRIALPSREQQIDAMLQTPLTSAPGDLLRYSNIGPGIAARAAETVTGTDFLKLAQERILQPLHLRNIVLAPGNLYDGRIATLQDPGSPRTDRETYNSPWWRSSGVPWGGYYGSTEDMVRFGASFLPNEQSPLSADAKREMVTDQVNGLEGGVESMYTHWTPGFWGLGWEIKGTKPRHWTGTKTSPETYLHWGFAGTLAWVDPGRELGVAVFANRSVVSQWMFKPARWTTLSDALCDVADELA